MWNEGMMLSCKGRDYRNPDGTAHHIPGSYLCMWTAYKHHGGYMSLSLTWLFPSLKKPLSVSFVSYYRCLMSVQTSIHTCSCILNTSNGSILYKTFCLVFWKLMLYLVFIYSCHINTWSLINKWSHSLIFYYIMNCKLHIKVRLVEYQEKKKKPDPITLYTHHLIYVITGIKKFLRQNCWVKGVGM